MYYKHLVFLVKALTTTSDKMIIKHAQLHDLFSHCRINITLHKTYISETCIGNCNTLTLPAILCGPCGPQFNNYCDLNASYQHISPIRSLPSHHMTHGSRSISDTAFVRSLFGFRPSAVMRAQWNPRSAAPFSFDRGTTLGHPSPKNQSHYSRYAF